MEGFVVEKKKLGYYTENYFGKPGQKKKIYRDQISFSPAGYFLLKKKYFHPAACCLFLNV